MTKPPKDKRVQKLLKYFSFPNHDRLNWLIQDSEAQVDQSIADKNRLMAFIGLSECGFAYRLQGAAGIVKSEDAGWRIFEKGVAYTAYSLLETPGIDAEALGHVIAHTALLGWTSLTEQLLARFFQITDQRERDWTSYHFLHLSVNLTCRLLGIANERDFSSSLGPYEGVEQELVTGAVSEATLRRLFEFHLETSSLTQTKLHQFAGNYDLIPLEFHLLSSVLAKMGQSIVTPSHPILDTPFNKPPSSTEAYRADSDERLQSVLRLKKL